MTATGYDHVQRGRFHLLLLALATLCALGGYWLGDREAGAPRLILVVTAGAMGFVAFCIRWLRVRDLGDTLLVHFGPIPLLRRRVDYRRITTVERGRSLLLEGWGVHYLPGRGWTWNLWGRDTVVVHLGVSTLRIGTDDPEGLLEFLRQRVNRI